MSRFDDAMKRALRRREPPAGFAERVLARAGELEAPRSRWKAFLTMRTGPRLRWASALAALVILVAGAQLYTVRQKRIRGERAKEQVLLAMKITANQLHATRQKVLEITAMENRR